MPMAQLKIIFEPFDNCSRFHAGSELPIVCEALFFGERPEIGDVECLDLETVERSFTQTLPGRAETSAVFGS